MPADYDPFIVESFIHGHRPASMTIPERREIVHRLKQRGHTNPTIADMLDVDCRLVEQDARRWRPQPADLAVAATSGARYPADRFDGEQIALAAARLIGRVHDECSTSVWDELAAMADVDVRALCVTLAACCDPNQSIHDMLEWTDELALAG